MRVDCRVQLVFTIIVAYVMPNEGFMHLAAYTPITRITFKWCHPKPLTDNYNELGKAAGIDSCCRALHHCTDYLSPNEVKYGLTNTDSVKSFNCECVLKFKHCLQSIQPPMNKLANYIGGEYFNMQKTNCFLKLYNETCTSYYNDNNEKFISNDNGEYFCARWFGAPRWFLQ